MKFEKIKCGNKKIFLYGLILGVVLLVVGTFIVSHAKYQNIEDIELVKGEINYRPYDFKMIAMYKSDDGTNYTEIYDRMPNSGYAINEEKSYCTTDGVNKDTTAKLYTENGKHLFENLIKSDKCYVYFDNATTAKSVSELATKISKIAKLEAPEFSVVATTDEGIYKTRDGMYGGYSYYWRGAATTNYVKFAGYCWRIIRINGDGSLRLIYDGTTCHANGTSTTDSIVSNVTYNSNYNRSEYVGWKYTSGVQRPTSITSGTDAPIKTVLESWYTTNITNKGYDGKVTTGKFCNDRNVASGYTWASAPSSTLCYAAYARLYTNSTPTLSCSTLDTYSLKVGLITADEIEFAGGNFANNTSYYLYNGQNYWTMSPSYLYYYSSSILDTNVIAVDSGGSLSSWSLNYTIGVRPVINLASSTTFAAGGTGTLDNPYVVS